MAYTGNGLNWRFCQKCKFQNCSPVDYVKNKLSNKNLSLFIVFPKITKSLSK